MPFEPITMTFGDLHYLVPLSPQQADSPNAVTGPGGQKELELLKVRPVPPAAGPVDLPSSLWMQSNTVALGDALKTGQCDSSWMHVQLLGLCAWYEHFCSCSLRVVNYACQTSSCWRSAMLVMCLHPSASCAEHADMLSCRASAAPSGRRH